MLVKFNCKNANLWNITIEAMEKKIESRFSRYFDVDDVAVNVKVTEQKLGFKVELTMPYLGQQLRAEVTDKESPLAAFDKGMDVLERQMSKCKTKLKRNKRQLPDITATPAEYEKSHSEQTVEQRIRPTGLLDPEVEVRPVEGQIDDLIGEINARVERGERVLITTLT